MASRIPSALFVLFLVVPSGLIAQQEESDRHFSAGAGVGLTTPVGNQSGKLDRAIHFEAGGGYFFNSHLGVTGNFLFTSPDVSAAELTRLSQISGSTNIIAITIDPTYQIGRAHV